MSEWLLNDDPLTWPTVSVVMPVRNEARHLDAAVSAVLAQAYPRPFDVWLAVGPSDDDTERVARAMAGASDQTHVVANPAGTTPAGLNAAIRASGGDVVVRVDGHAELSAGYVRRAVETMSRTGAVNVGGRQRAVGETAFERAVAAAMSSRLGTGGARFHIGGAEGPVDTVYLGVFRRTALEQAGLFAEDLVRNQDYELNIRLRAAGGVVWFDPVLEARYRPRGSLAALARQYAEYGRWKAVVVRRHPTSLRLRQLAPPIGVTFLAVAAVTVRRRMSQIVLAAYGAANLAEALRARNLRSLLVLPTIHVCWTAGFLAGMLRKDHLDETGGERDDDQAGSASFRLR